MKQPHNTPDKIHSNHEREREREREREVNWCFTPSQPQCVCIKVMRDNLN